MTMKIDAGRVFDAALKARESIRRPDNRHPIQIAFEAAIQTAWKARHPRARKLNYAHCAASLQREDPAKYAEIRAEFSARAVAAVDAYDVEVKALDAALREAALEAPVRPADHVWSVWESVSTSTYRTQSDPGSYVRFRLNMLRDLAKEHGLKVHKHTRDIGVSEWRDWYGRPCSQSYYTVDVWVNADPRTVEILRQREGK